MSKESALTVCLSVCHPDGILVILVICGVSAVLMILTMGVGMKIKLKRENGESIHKWESFTQYTSPFPNTDMIN